MRGLWGKSPEVTVGGATEQEASVTCMASQKTSASPFVTDPWHSVSYTSRSLLAAGALGACVLLSAFSATASANRAAVVKSQQLALANEAELAAGLAEYLSEKTVAARHAVSAPGAASLRSAVEGVADGGGALDKFVKFDFAEISLAEFEAREQRCLAQAIYYEARSESRIGQMAVADVVLNRVKSPIYPNTVCGVVYQGSERRTGCQFTFTCDGAMDAAVNVRKMRAAEQLAGAVLAGIRAPVTHNATHYHAYYVSPEWAGEMVKTATIGAHTFYKFGPRGGATPQTAKAEQ